MTADLNDMPEKFSIAEWVKENKLPEIHIFFQDQRHGGWLCQGCLTVLLAESNLKKVVKTSVKVGNSSAVILPHSWLGKKIVAALAENE